MTRSLADQSVAELGGPLSVLTRQKRDHVRLDRLLRELDDAAAGPDQDRVLRRIARLVFPHAFAEEAVLWPAIRAALPDGDDLTLQVESEHQEINELWSTLETLPSTHPHRAEVLDRIVELLREDVRDEEDVLLPRLQDALDVGRLRTLGVAWEAVRRTAPTRPHPVVARRPPGNTRSALPLTVLDRTRDTLDLVALRAPSWRDRLSRASGGLARVSSRVERIPPLRRGERSETSRG